MFNPPNTAVNSMGLARETNTRYGDPAHRAPSMREVEDLVRAALQAGQTVRYRVTAIFVGNVPYPIAVSVQARGTKPDGTAGINEDRAFWNWTHHRY
jgi:hypothetical protein